MRLDVRSGRWSRILVVLGGIGLLLTGIVGYLNAVLVNGDKFADILNDIRQDQAVSEQVGEQIALSAVDAQPDLVAVQPAIAAGAAAVIRSPLLDGVFTPAVRSFHAALTEEGGTSAVLTLADLGATVTTALETFAPDFAQALPDDLNVTFAQVGGQEGIAEQIIPFIQLISTLAWVVPLLTLLAMIGAVWLAPRRRAALVGLGWVFVIVGATLGIGVLAMNVASLFFDVQTLSGAVVAASLQQFSQPLAVRFIAFMVVGGLLIAAAGALLPQVNVGQQIRDGLALVTRRPHSPMWQVARALAIIAVSTLVVLFPSFSAQAVAVVVGLAVFFLGVAELDLVAERQRAADEAATAVAEARGEEAQPMTPPRGLWLIPVVAGVAAAVVIGALLVPEHLPQDHAVPRSAPDSAACNGHVELCDKPFDQVVIAASHNSMSVADGTWFLAEQPKDMVSSLDDGIRGLLVDTWYGQPAANGRAITADRSIAGAEAQLVATYGRDVAASVRRTIDRVRNTKPTGPVAPYFCHTVCELGATAMAPEMQRLNAWMDAHPRDVVVMFIQDTVTPADTDAVLRGAGLAAKAYAHPDGAPWPTLQQMIDQDKRLVVLMENHGGGARFPYLHQGFDLVQDTEYTFDSVSDFTCTLKRGHADSPLFNVNHWLASFTKLVSNAEKVNVYDVLKPRVDECETVRGRVPTMISVNWYDRGDLFRVVDELNGVG